MQRMLDKKKLEFSFEVKSVRDKIPEIEEVKETLAKGETAVELLIKTGNFAEANRLKKQLIEAKKYEIELLDIVMNLDFTRPKEKMIKLANELGIDIKDPILIGEFKKLQQERIDEL